MAWEVDSLHRIPLTKHHSPTVEGVCDLMEDICQQVCSYWLISTANAEQMQVFAGQMDAQDGVASNEPWIQGLEWRGKDGFKVAIQLLSIFAVQHESFQLFSCRGANVCARHDRHGNVLFIHIEIFIVARHGTKKVRHAMPTRVSKTVSKEIAVSDGGNLQILARAPLKTPKFCI